MKSMAFDNSNPEVCDGMVAASQFRLNGLYYFANARYDFHAKIWISLGLKFSPKILPADLALD